MSEENVNPNELIASVAKPRLTICTIISLVVHIALLLLLSIGFLKLCFQYKTIHPKDAIKMEQKAQAEAEKKKADEDRLKNAQLKAKEEAEKAGDKAENAKEDAAAPAAAAKDAPKKAKSKIEQKLEETADPSTASMDQNISF